MECTVKHFNELTSVELYEILQIRAEVFVVEQNCVYQDLDNKDKGAYHVFLHEDGKVKAYLRVLAAGVSYEDASIGRVLTIQRGTGLGKQLLLEGIKVAKEKFNADKIRISAQSYAKGFYEQVGFKQVSEEYLEDGIWHMEMLLENL